jgi:hypothetical protein
MYYWNNSGQEFVEKNSEENWSIERGEGAQTWL